MNNYKIISLGFNCFIKIFTNDSGIKQETNFFDYIGTSMWAINKLFENNFANLFNEDDYENLKIQTDNLIVITNKHYYFRFLHDFKNNTNINLIKFNIDKTIDQNIIDDVKLQFNKFKEAYERRIIRLKDLLIKEKKILFIRLEETMHNRIIYDEYKSYFEKPELDYIIDYSKMIKINYPNLDFKIIYISKIHDNKYMIENNLIILNSKNVAIDDWRKSSNGLKDLFRINKEFLDSIL
jgi:hypothetical protein